MCCLVGLLLALRIFPRTDLMKQTLSLVCLLPLRFTTDQPSDRDIRRKEFTKRKLIKTYFRSSIQRVRLNSLTFMSTESEISRVLNFDKVLKDIANAKARKISFS